jgi:hypothetical protein
VEKSRSPGSAIAGRRGENKACVRSGHLAY